MSFEKVDFSTIKTRESADLHFHGLWHGYLRGLGAPAGSNKDAGVGLETIARFGAQCKFGAAIADLASTHRYLSSGAGILKLDGKPALERFLFAFWGSVELDRLAEQMKRKSPPGAPNLAHQLRRLHMLRQERPEATILRAEELDAWAEGKSISIAMRRKPRDNSQATPAAAIATASPASIKKPRL